MRTCIWEVGRLCFLAYSMAILFSLPACLVISISRVLRCLVYQLYKAILWELFLPVPLYLPFYPFYWDLGTSQFYAACRLLPSLLWYQPYCVCSLSSRACERSLSLVSCELFPFYLNAFSSCYFGIYALLNSWPSGHLAPGCRALTNSCSCCIFSCSRSFFVLVSDLLRYFSKVCCRVYIMRFALQLAGVHTEAYSAFTNTPCTLR